MRPVGCADSPTAIMSDINANWDALRAVLSEAGHVDQVWCLGDMVDMGPQPNECLEALRECQAVCVLGNHERWVLGQIPEPLRHTSLPRPDPATTRAAAPPLDNLFHISRLVKNTHSG
jgi:hypothetical protein